MASVLASQKFLANNKVMHFNHSPGDTNNNYTSWQEFKNYGTFTASYIRSVGTGDLSVFKIYAATDSNGTDATEIKASTANANAVGDYCFLECQASELSLDPTKNFTHISTRIQLGTGTDDGVVTYIFSNPRFAYKDLTRDSIA